MAVTKTDVERVLDYFGNDIEVPRRWLVRYEHLREEVAFNFLTEDEELFELK